MVFKRFLISLYTPRALLLFLGMYLLLAVGFLLPAESFVSPDENANAFFATAFAEQSVLSVPVPLNNVTNDALFPRSVIAKDGMLYPGSFLGLPVVYGLVAKLLFFVPTRYVLLSITPVLACVLLWMLYRSVKTYGDERTAVLTTLFFGLHPWFVYSTTRSMMHNVLFLFLLVAGVWVTTWQRAKNWRFVLSGLGVGLALFVRTSEVLWVGVGALALLLAFVPWKGIVRWMCGFGVGIGALLVSQKMVYGDWFTSGYTFLTSTLLPVSVTATAGATNDVTFFSRLSTFLFPFGIHIDTLQYTLQAYLWHLAPWYFALAIVGILSGVICLFNLLVRLCIKTYIVAPAQAGAPHRLEKTESRFLDQGRRWIPACAGMTGLSYSWLIVTLIGSLISLYLILFYGSWDIHDNPDPTQATLANSYIRYWLPVCLFFSLMAARFCVVTYAWIKTNIATNRQWMVRATSAVFLVSFVLTNISLLYFSSEDALWVASSTLKRQEQIHRELTALIPQNAVVIVDRSDKLVFPERMVRYPLRDERTYGLIPTILQSAPLYYYGITLPQVDLDYLNQDKLKKDGVGIEFVKTFDEESLYRLYVVQPLVH